MLGEQSGRLFKPLAFTKTFAMASAAFLAITVIPVLMTLLISSRVLPSQWGRRKNLLVTLLVMFAPAALLLIVPLPRYDEYRHWFALAWAILAGMLLVEQRMMHEQANPISRLLQRVVQPFFVLAMRFRWAVLVLAVLAVASIAIPLTQLGSEFMPPLEEGDLLYMPTTDPGISITKARELIQQTDKLLMQFPEIKSVMGKVGNAETATDPAPPSMIETTITLKRDKSKSGARAGGAFLFRLARLGRLRYQAKLSSESRPITVDELVYGYEWPGGQHVPGLNEALQIPGLTNSWTMPIRTPIDMLSTGIKTPVGVKVLGPDLKTLSELTGQIAQTLKTSDGTGAYTVSTSPRRASAAITWTFSWSATSIKRLKTLLMVSPP